MNLMKWGRKMSKKVNTGRMIDKNMVVTTLLLVIMFAMYLIEQAYGIINPYTSPRVVTWVICILAFALGIVFLVLGFKKKESYFEFSAWAGGIAILVMLLKINFEIKSLGVAIPGTLRVLNFIPMVMVLMTVYIVVSWIYIIYKVVTKKVNA